MTVSGKATTNIRISIMTVPKGNAEVDWSIHAILFKTVAIIINGAGKNRKVATRFAVQVFPPKYLNKLELAIPDKTIY